MGRIVNVHAATPRSADAVKLPVMRQILVSVLLACLTACRGTGGVQQQTPPAQPNILLIVLDTVRYDATPADPTSANSMPFFSSLIRAGVNFTQAYSTFDSTPHSHFSMLTGFHSGLSSGLDVPEHSVAYHLGKAGYHTFGVAANGNLSQRSSLILKPFHRYTCLLDVWQAMSTTERTKELGWIDPALQAYGLAPNAFNRLMRYTSARTVMSIFKQEMSAIRTPFFGFINLVDAHDPYIPDPSSYDATERERKWAHAGFNSDLRERKLPAEVMNPASIADKGRRDRVLDALAKTSTGVDSYRRWQTAFDLSGDELEIYRSRYRASVRQLDSVLREVFETLERQRLIDTTLVIITSDHGEAFGEQDLITHWFLNRGDREVTNRIPLVILFPTVYGVGARTVSAPVVGSDIAPTVYDLVGLDWSSLPRKAHPGNFGKSLLPLLGRGGMTAGQRRAIEIGPPSATELERARARKESEERLRSLGYIGH
jgi:arylsulfatase A-like enzyme